MRTPSAIASQGGVRAGSGAFSLVEVVLALGIVSFALLAVVGVFSGVVGKARENVERRSIAEAVDSLRGHLLLSGFEQSYQWARNGQELVYVTFRAAENGQPQATGPRVLGRWLPAGDSQQISGLEAARVGRWVKARLSVSASNPSGTNLPELPGAYGSGVLAVLAQMDAVAEPSLPLPERPRFENVIGVTR